MKERRGKEGIDVFVGHEHMEHMHTVETRKRRKRRDRLLEMRE